MKMHRIVLACLPCLPAALLAQPQIGGGICSSSTLSGNYSLTLTGRDVSSSAGFSSALQGIGIAAFDGLSKVTFTLTNNTNKALSTPQTLSGEYSLQANCVGAVNITSGDTASFTLESFNSGGGYLITGQDGTYSYTGSGSELPESCTASELSGAYAFNGAGFALASGAIAGVNYISGIVTFDGTSAITTNWYVSANGATTATSTSGSYSVTSGCTATANLTDSMGNTYVLAFTITSAKGTNFIVSGANAQTIFSGAGRTLGPIFPGFPATCSAATLTGTRSLALSGRDVTGAVLSKTSLSVGTATFDGAGKVTFNLTTDTNQSQSTAQTLSGIYSLPSNCAGAINIATGDTASFTLIAFNQGKNFTITGQDATYGFTGGGAEQPATCLTSTFSGTYAFSGNGFALASGVIGGVNSISGLLQFDGAGAINGNWSIATIGAATNATVAGHYSVSSSCLANALVTDASGASYDLAFTVTSADGANFSVLGASPLNLFTAAGHSTFTNPGLAVELAAGSGLTAPPGSLFSIYGSDLSAGQGQATSFPLPTTLASTTVTINGEKVPLYYVNDKALGTTGLINAQMPLDVQPGVATLVVKNGTDVSNSVAVTVPATAVPGVFIYGNNHAASQNLPGYTLNSPSTPASVGDIVVVYFTGGGPVQGESTLVFGQATPVSLFPVTETASATLGGVPATVEYAGLTPTAVGGLYQANIVIPNGAAGEQSLVITIGGTASNATSISTK